MRDRASRLPTFLVIGAAKAGTTSLYTYLDQHPDVFMSPIKEPRFFSGARRGSPRWRAPRWTYPITDLSEYLALFDGAVTERARGEASTYYLPSPEAPRRAHELIPDARLVAILRDPVERAYSSFNHERREGRQAIADFRTAFAADLVAPPDDARGYREDGLYARNLSRWLDLFPSGQLQIHLYEDLVGDPVGVLQAVFRHIGVDDGFVPDVSRRFNAAGLPRSSRLQRLLSHPPDRFRDWVRALVPTRLRRGISLRMANANLRAVPPLSPEVRAEVLPSFVEDIFALQELLGRDLSGWLDRDVAVGQHEEGWV